MRAIFAAAVAFGLGGVGAPPPEAQAADRAYSRILTTVYDRSDVRRLFAGEAPVEIIGAPGGDAQAVAAALEAPAYFGDPEFVALPSTPDTREASRLVLVFGGGGNGTCEGRRTGGGAPDRLFAVICYGDKAVTEARLTSASLRNPTTPEFGRAVRQLLTYMTPVRNPLREDNDRIRLFD